MASRLDLLASRARTLRAELGRSLEVTLPRQKVEKREKVTLTLEARLFFFFFNSYFKWVEEVFFLFFSAFQGFCLQGFLRGFSSRFGGFRLKYGTIAA